MPPFFCRAGPGAGFGMACARRARKKKAVIVSLPRATAKFGSAKWKVTKKDGKKVLNLSGNSAKVKKARRMAPMPSS